MSNLTNWMGCSQVRYTPYGTECQFLVGTLMSNFGYQLPKGTCQFPFPEWCISNSNELTCTNPDYFGYLHNTWETCGEYQYAPWGTSTTPSHQCRLDKTILDAKYALGTYCPYGNDSKGQVESTYVIGIFLLLWAVYAMMFFGNSRR